MRILFVGDEGEYNAVLERREDATPFSLFYSDKIPVYPENISFDAVLVPGLKLLSQPSTYLNTLIACGSADLVQECFDAGCHDYIREPFTEAELHARVKARTRRRLEFDSTMVVVQDGRLSGPDGSARFDDGYYSILALLSNNPHRPVPREAIAAILGVSANSSRAIDMRISRLRGILRSVGASNLADSIQCKNNAYMLLL